MLTLVGLFEKIPPNVDNSFIEIYRYFFPQSKKCEYFVSAFIDDSFVLGLSYLVDICVALNMLNHTFQGRDETVCKFVSTLKAFPAKTSAVMG